MANHKSAKKRIRQNEKRRKANQAAKSACRTAMKKVRASVEAGDKDGAKENLRLAQKVVATAVTKGLYHKNNGARKISRLAKLVSAA